MKTRVFSCLLCLVLMLMCFSVPSVAEETDADVQYRPEEDLAIPNEICVKDENNTWKNLSAANPTREVGGGTAEFDPEAGVLTITDIRAKRIFTKTTVQDLYIIVKGTNTISGDGALALLVELGGKIVITGDGILNIGSESFSGCGIIGKQDDIVIMGNVTVNIQTTNAASITVMNTKGNCNLKILENASVHAKGRLSNESIGGTVYLRTAGAVDITGGSSDNNGAIYSMGNVEIYDTELTLRKNVSNGWAHGINVNSESGHTVIGDARIHVYISSSNNAAVAVFSKSSEVFFQGKTVVDGSIHSGDARSWMFGTTNSKTRLYLESEPTISVNSTKTLTNYATGGLVFRHWCRYEYMPAEDEIAIPEGTIGIKRADGGWNTINAAHTTDLTGTAAGQGFISYDSSTGVLVLENVELARVYLENCPEQDLYIVWKGSCKVIPEQGFHGIFIKNQSSGRNIILTGDGTVSVQSPYSSAAVLSLNGAIIIRGDMIFEADTVGDYGIENYSSSNADIRILENAAVSVVAGKCPIANLHSGSNVVIGTTGRVICRTRDGKRADVTVSGDGSVIFQDPFIYGTSVSLGSDLAMNYYVRNCVPGAQMRITFHGAEWMLSGEQTEAVNEYRFSFTGIAPQCMGDRIDAQLIDGENVLAEKLGGSIVAYCESVTQKTAGQLGISEEKLAEMKVLIADLLNYGAEAQKYQNYAVDKLVNAGIDGGTVFEAPAVTDKTVTTADGTGDTRFLSAGVRFDNTVQLYFRFYAPLAEEATVTVNGVPVAFSAVEGVENTYAVYTNGIAAGAFDDVYTVELKLRDETVQTVTYSINSYVYSMYADEKVGALVQALYNYGVSAKTFLTEK